MKKIFGLHIPKCGGTSLLEAFKNNLEPHLIYQNTSLYENLMKNKAELHQIFNFESIYLAFGHHLYDELLKLFKPDFIFTFLRDPYSIHLSNFKYINRLRFDNGGTLITFDEYLSYSEVGVCNFLISRFPKLISNKKLDLHFQAIEILSHFNSVLDIGDFSSTEIMDEFQRSIDLQITPIPALNISPLDDLVYNLPSNEVILEILNNKFKEDFLLYEKFIELRNNLTLNPFFDENLNNKLSANFYSLDVDYEKIIDNFSKSLVIELRTHNAIDSYLEFLERDKLFIDAIISKSKIEF